MVKRIGDLDCLKNPNLIFLKINWLPLSILISVKYKGIK